MSSNLIPKYVIFAQNLAYFGSKLWYFFNHMHVSLSFILFYHSFWFFIFMWYLVISPRIFRWLGNKSSFLLSVIIILQHMTSVLRHIVGYLVLFYSSRSEEVSMKKILFLIFLLILIWQSIINIMISVYIKFNVVTMLQLHYYNALIGTIKFAKDTKHTIIIYPVKLLHL